MAWIELDRRNGLYKLGFRLGDRKFKRSLQTSDLKDAETARSVADDTLAAIERGWTQVPTDVDIGDFVLSGGRLQREIVLREAVTICDLFEAYFERLPDDSLEASTVNCMKLHRKHLEKYLGKSKDLERVTFGDLQKYVERRSHDKGHRGRRLMPVTIKKEIVTLRTVWNWGRRNGLIDKVAEFPGKSLKYPKAVEKPPFMTVAEIEQRAKKATPAEATDLWERAFLSLPEIDEILRLVKDRARHEFIYPMFVFAAHTGARRSEMLRSKLVDLDFDRRIITIHERKKSHDQRTTRQVPMSGALKDVLQSWLENHPGGEHTFCEPLDMPRSRCRSDTVTPLTRDEAHDHFKRTLIGTRWETLRGWHVFRHSFCSNCAAKGIDQRVINAWVGHLSDAMVRRYQHLLPDQQRAAIDLVFGDSAPAARPVSTGARRFGGHRGSFDGNGSCQNGMDYRGG